MLLLAGTIPTADNELHTGEAGLEGDVLVIGDRRFPLNRGTAAMIGAACKVACLFGEACPRCVVAGDIGKRSGSRLIYRHLAKNLPEMSPSALGLHYIVPDLGLHNQMLITLRRMKQKPCLIADAGFMYVAKASGQARYYDLFLPDLGELTFLADDKASHPAYTRGFLTRLEDDPARLIETAYATGNSAHHLCVKGSTDYICAGGQAIAQVNEPMIEALEAIGGTGDTITGMVAALIHHGCSITDACSIACRANRLAGALAQPTPATQIAAIIHKIPEALREAVQEYPLTTDKRIAVQNDSPL